jgi:glycogen operon protein
MRGIDNLSYYRLAQDDMRYYQDFTGCGNTLNMTNARVLQSRSSKPPSSPVRRR